MYEKNVETKDMIYEYSKTLRVAMKFEKEILNIVSG